MLGIIPFINSPTSPFAENRMINLESHKNFLKQACQLIAVFRVYILALSQKMKLMSAAQNYNIDMPF